MPDFELLFPGRFVKKTDLSRPTTIRIVSVTPADLNTDESNAAAKQGGKVKKERAQGLVKFKAQPGSLGEYKGDEWVLCKTNAALIAACLDERDFEKWAGRCVTIYNDPTVGFGGQIVGGIRVYGSPDLKSDRRVEIKMPRKSAPEVYHLHPTGKKQEPTTTLAQEPTA